jgi:hypothetical protein
METKNSLTTFRKIEPGFDYKPLVEGEIKFGKNELSVECDRQCGISNATLIARTEFQGLVYDVYDIGAAWKYVPDKKSFGLYATCNNDPVHPPHLLPLGGSPESDFVGVTHVREEAKGNQPRTGWCYFDYMALTNSSEQPQKRKV